MSVATRGSRAPDMRDCLDQRRARNYRAAVSLHAHTHHSREVLADLPPYIVRIPLVAHLFERAVRDHEEREGRSLDFTKGWWHPPVTPRAVFQSEVAQIEKLQLAPLVSVTDHDDITACLELQTLYNPVCAPVSFEWTARWGAGYFHFGIHNLPVDLAALWFARLAEQTRCGGEDRLRDLLAALSREPDVLVVLNHPLWDLADVGRAAHEQGLAQLLNRFRPYIHALELNGFRSWSENEATCQLSAEVGMPVISGGDRHACAPNAMLNLTHSGTFAEFVEEVRAGVSEVLIMPEYRENLGVRKLAAAAEILRRYPTYPPERQKWTDRVSCEHEGEVRPLSHHWPDGGPLWVRSAVSTFLVVTSSIGMPVVNLALTRLESRRTAETPRLAPPFSVARGLSQN